MRVSGDRPVPSLPLSLSGLLPHVYVGRVVYEDCLVYGDVVFPLFGAKQCRQVAFGIRCVALVLDSLGGLTSKAR